MIQHLYTCCLKMSTQLIGNDLYPLTTPYQTGYLKTNGHQIYYEISGNPEGPAALFLHGGPGGGTSARDRCFFNPEHYRVVLMDQRGSGQSIPNASKDYGGALFNNSTQYLIDDIELLRKEISVDQWQLILGGSWGSTLAIAYAEQHPNQCKQLLLRGVFTALPDEIDALFQNGTTANHYPEEWDQYTSYIQKTSQNWNLEKQNLLAAYQRRLFDPSERLEAAKAFAGYELSISCLHGINDRVRSIMSNPEKLVPFASLEVHYMLQGCFLKRGQLIENVDAIKDHRIHIVHGRNDSVCLPRAAWRLLNALKTQGAGDNVTLNFVQAAGHSDSDENIARSLRQATDQLINDA